MLKYSLGAANSLSFIRRRSVLFIHQEQQCVIIHQKQQFVFIHQEQQCKIFVRSSKFVIIQQEQQCVIIYQCVITYQ